MEHRRHARITRSDGPACTSKNGIALVNHPLRLQSPALMFSPTVHCCWRCTSMRLARFLILWSRSVSAALEIGGVLLRFDARIGALAVRGFALRSARAKPVAP